MQVVEKVHTVSHMDALQFISNIHITFEGGDVIFFVKVSISYIHIHLNFAYIVPNAVSVLPSINAPK
jgi:hypothetical protein